MRLDTFFIGVAILLGFLIAGFLIIGNQTSEYHLNVSEDKYFTNTEDSIDTIINVTGDMKDRLIREDSYNINDMFGWLLDSTYKSGILIWTMLKAPFNLITDFLIFFKLPETFSKAISGLINAGLLIMIIFFFIYMYQRFQPR